MGSAAEDKAKLLVQAEALRKSEAATAYGCSIDTEFLEGILAENATLSKHVDDLTKEASDLRGKLSESQQEITDLQVRVESLASQVNTARWSGGNPLW